MNRCALKLTASFFVLMAHAPGLWADGYRCGRKLITSGDSSGDLIRVCGEPHHKDRGYEKIKVNGVSKDTRVERWYYKKNSRSLEHVILIYKGRVNAIKVGGR